MRRGRGLRAVTAAVLAFAVLCVAGFGWLLALRTCWRGDRLRLAEAFGDAERGMPWTLSRDGDVLISPDGAADFFYQRFLMSADTVPVRFSGRGAEAGAIRLTLPRAEVTLSDAGGGNTRAEWTLDGKHYGYTLSGVLPFSHLEQYVDNLVRWQADGEAKGEGENG